MRRVTLTLIALAVFLPSLALARTQFLCIDRVVRDTCCCPPHANRAKAPMQTTLQRGCCKVERHAAMHAPVSTEPAPSQTIGPVAVAVAITEVTGAARDARIAVIPRAQAPPPLPTLLSQHAALLL